MIWFKKISACILFGVLSIQTTNVLALTNKESFLSSLNSLDSSITASISDSEKALSDRANKLGSEYDARLKTLGYSLDEVEALTQIKKFNAPNFRHDVSEAYTTKKTEMFSDIKDVHTSLASLRDEITLGYSDLSNAQKQSYDAKLTGYQLRYNTFLSGSTVSLSGFSSAFSGELSGAVASVSKIMRENGDYVRFIANLRKELANLDANKSLFLSGNTTFENTVLPKLQGEISAFANDKKNATDTIRKNLEDGLSKALLQERLKKQESELRAALEDIMSKWKEYVGSDFGQDEVFLLQSLESKNLLSSDKTLRASVYEDNGDLRSLDLSSGSGILSDVKKLSGDFTKAAASLSSINSRYGSGNLLSSLRSSFAAAYPLKLKEYQNTLASLFQTQLNTSLLSEVNHAQNLKLIDTEEKLLQTNLSTTVSYDFSRNLVENFYAKLDSIAKKDPSNDIASRIEKVKYKYDRIVLQKKIESDEYVAYFSQRKQLDASINAFLSSYAANRPSAKTKFVAVLSRLTELAAWGWISVKKQYQLLVLKSDILQFLENASH